MIGKVSRVLSSTRSAPMPRSQAADKVQALVDELTRDSADFARLWASHDVRHFSGGLKRLRLPELGELALEYSAFSVDGRPDLSMLVYNPSTPEDRARIVAALERQADMSP